MENIFKDIQAAVRSENINGIVFHFGGKIMKMQFELLVAEDDIGNFLLFKRLLARWEFEYPVRHFSNGNHLMNFIHNNIEENTKYILLLDLDMPVMDGIETLSLIRQDANLSGIRIYIRTTDKSQETIDYCYQLGCDGYFLKPMKKCQLEDIFNSINEITSTDTREPAMI